MARSWLQPRFFGDLGRRLAPLRARRCVPLGATGARRTAVTLGGRRPAAPKCVETSRPHMRSTMQCLCMHTMRSTHIVILAHSTTYM